MKYKLSVILIVFSFALTAQVKWNLFNDTAVKWYYYDGDEFTNNIIDEVKWMQHLPWSRKVISSGSYYLNENSRIDTGYAYFKIDRYNKFEPLYDWELKDNYITKHPERLKDNSYLFNYSGGLIWSNKQYKYGQFEIRFKSPKGSGIWPAFWLYGGDPNYEIDFFELKGEKNDHIHVDVHCPDGCRNYRNSFFDFSKGWGHWIKTSNEFNEDFNVVSGIWDEEGISYFLNGSYLAYYKGNINKSMNLTAGIGIAQNDGPFKPGENATTIFPSEIAVDYVRVWSNKDTMINKVSNYNFYNHSMISSTSNNKAEVDIKKGKNSKKNKFRTTNGEITLLPLSRDRYSLTVLGKKLEDVLVIVVNNNKEKVFAKSISNSHFEILDFAGLKNGEYTVIINVANQRLTHSLFVQKPTH